MANAFSNTFYSRRKNKKQASSFYYTSPWLSKGTNRTLPKSFASWLRRNQVDHNAAADSSRASDEDFDAVSAGTVSTVAFLDDPLPPSAAGCCRKSSSRLVDDQRTKAAHAKNVVDAALTQAAWTYDQFRNAKFLFVVGLNHHRKDDFTYPAEVTMAEFSFAKGIEHVFHCVVDLPPDIAVEFQVPEKSSLDAHQVPTRTTSGRFRRAMPVLTTSELGFHVLQVVCPDASLAASRLMPIETQRWLPGYVSHVLEGDKAPAGPHLFTGGSRTRFVVTNDVVAEETRRALADVLNDCLEAEARVNLVVVEATVFARAIADFYGRWLCEKTLHQTIAQCGAVQRHQFDLPFDAEEAFCRLHATINMYKRDILCSKAVCLRTVALVNFAFAPQADGLEK